ncbi:hypothetical protein FNAPI_5857 [Fusarium napiforme]|uniref:VOC domain-containing protein n=1 Tax=Fusarium napiforme TaxID=42672 RepID=A0A8H5JMY0_9HYPO|nr:hypothetical protein FNAPI_5857 [Fusarium napiforme]
MSFKLVKLYHPSHRVPDLAEAERFFRVIFGLESVWRKDLFSKPNPKFPTYPTDYCIFTTIADVFFDCIDPKKYVIDGIQRYETIQHPHLHGFGWGVEGIDEIYSLMQRAGFATTDQANRPSDPMKCPVASFNDSKLFYTTPQSSGVRLEFYSVESIGWYDPRKSPSWKLLPSVGKGCMGIQFCSHHTILTADMGRALKLYRDTLGGRVIHEEKSTLRGTESVFVALADSIFELAVPDSPSSYAWVDYESRKDSETDVYHALTWKVIDLEAVVSHLETQGVKIIAQHNGMVVVDPADGIGIPWGFSAKLVPGDDRYINELA